MEPVASLLSSGISEAITAYELPFEFLYTESSRLSRGISASLEIIPSDAVTDGLVSEIDSLVTTFYMLASTGALGGTDVPPWESSVEHPSRPQLIEGGIQWHFDSARVSQPAIAILAQLIGIAAETNRIKRASLTCPGGRGLATLPSDSKRKDWYPRTWPDLPFEISLSEEIRKSATLAIQFQRPLSLAERWPIEVELLTWATATRIGSYGVAPIPPDRCGLIPDEHPAFFDDGLEISFHNIRCHPAAFRGLANVCAAIARKLVPIRSVTL